MLNRIIEGRIQAAERDLGVPLDYVRYLARTSLKNVMRLTRFQRLADAGGSVPASATGVATIVGSMADDCGTCVQISVNIAKQHGVSPDIIRAAVQRRREDLADELRDVFDFADGVTSGIGVDDDLRERIRARWGDQGLIDLSMTVAMHRVYPTLKRALGYAKSCELVPVTVE